ncbi:uncharacterized protein [Amphiura filiformis]|uniref:uncharacterized protein isoform X2 n=1 Tax=Amphiura filiformis TaxID=82378 RepID=UPI003B21DFBE
MTPKGGSTPEKSPSCSPPRTPTLLAPPPRFKDHSKIRQTRSFDETLRSRNQDEDVIIKDEQEAIEEETIRLSQGVLLEGAASPVSGISRMHKKKLTENQQGTPPDWGAKLESLANLEDLMETEREMRRRLNSFEKSFDDVKNEKQMALKELKTLHDAVHRNKADIQKAEEMTAKNLEKADGIRSELMVLEYQRDQARRELKDLEESIHARQGSPGVDQSHGNSWTTNASDQDLLNMTANEIREIIQDRDDLKSRLRSGQGDLSPVERSELQRQLSATKHDLFNEQKSSRVKIDQLEEELEESRLRIDELSKLKLDLSAQLEQLNDSLHAADDSSTRQDETNRLQEENEQLQMALQDKDEYIVSAKASVREKEQAVTKQREELMKVKRQLSEAHETNETLMQERQEDFKKLNMDKALAVDETRDVMKREQKLAIDQLRLSLGKDKKEALARQEEKLQEQMAVKHSLLLTKEEELLLLKEDMKRLKRSAEQDEEERALAMQKKIEEAVDKAKDIWDEEMGRSKRREQAMREEEFAKEAARLHEEIRKEKMMTDNTKATIAALKEEIAELQEKRLAAGREKVEAVSEARDATRQEMQAEWDRLRQQLTQEKNSEVALLKENMAQKDEELEKLRSEVKKRLEQQVTAADTIDKTSSRGIIAEINEECNRTAAIMGTHKKINGLKNDKHSKSPSSSSNANYVNGHHGNTPGRTQVLAALSNLHSSNDELRTYVQTVKDDLEKQKKMVTKLQKDKDHLKVVDDLQKTVHNLQSSEAGMQKKLANKDEELREIQRGMAKWKEESAYKMAQKFEEELNRELEIRLHEKKERQELMRSGPKSVDQSQDSSSPSNANTPPNDASTIQHLRHLQERVRHLQAENISLRKNGRTSQMDTSPQSSQNEVDEKAQHIYQLQQKVMILDRQLHIAEDRCRDNAAHLSEKGSENNKLQSALAQQTKELMRMERAYAKLSQSARRQPVAL